MSRPKLTRDKVPIWQPSDRGAEPLNRGKCIIEIAEILAAGLMRAEARKSSRNSSALGESSLDFTPAKSGHPTLNRSERLE